MTLSRIAAAGLVAAAVGISACSSSSKKSSSSAAATTVAPTTTASPSTTIDPALRTQLQNALLVPSDVGPGFTSGTYKPGDPTKPEPCGQPNISAKYPEVLKVGTVIMQGTTLNLTEEVVVYSDIPTADAALAAGLEGVNCTAAKFYADDGSAIDATLTPGTDVTAQVGGTKAMEYTIKATGIQGYLIAVEYKQSITAFSFLADPTADTSSAPSPLVVAKKAIDKLAAA